jgi:hypothetical protein
MKICIHRAVNNIAQTDYYNQRFEQTPTVVSTADELKSVVEYDHTFSAFRGTDKNGDSLPGGQGYKNAENWVSSQCLWFDVDNSHTDDPSLWAQPEEVQAALDADEICYTMYTSKSHMQGKDRPDGSFESARPKMHVAIPLSQRVEDPDRMLELMDLLRRYVERQIEGAKRIVTDSSCWEIARKFYGSQANVKIWWKEGKRCFDELDMAKVREEAEEEIRDGAQQREGREKKSNLQRMLEEFEDKKRGTGQHLLVMKATESLRMKSSLDNAECETIVRTFARTMDGVDDEAWRKDFKAKFDEGMRWVERQVKSDEARLNGIVEKYDAFYAHVWWGHTKVLIDKVATTDPKNRTGAVIRNISDVQAEEEADLNPSRLVCYRHYDPKYRREAVTCSSEFAYWLEEARKRHVEVIFDPSLPPGMSQTAKRGFVYNLWRGFGVQPCPEGDWTRTCEYILDVLARGNVELFNYYLDWMAQVLQHPETLPEVALAFYSGPQRTGKGTFYRILKGLLGPWNCVQVSNSERATAKFNALMENKLVVLLDECVWGGDIKDRQMLKSAISETEEVIERKGLDPISMRNFKRFLISSNAHHHTPVERYNKRYLCQEISSKHRSDRGYFGAIWEELENGGYAKMMYDLLRRDISKRNWAAFPETKETMRQMVYSFDKAEAFIFDSLKAGEPIEFGKVKFLSSERFDTAWAGFWFKGHNETQTVRQALEVFKRIFGPLVKTNDRSTTEGLGQERGTTFYGTLAQYRAAFAKYCGCSPRLLFGKPRTRTVQDRSQVA